MNKILTVGIPTYNRAATLELALTSLASQSPEALEKVHVLVSNNASTDNTREVVERFRPLFPHFEYVENATNKGMDFNMAQAFRLAETKYSWIFSDDDFLLPNQLGHIVGILEQEEIGSLFLQPTWYREQPADASLGDLRLAYERFANPLDYLAQVHYWVGFITGNIVNKDLVRDLPALYQFDGTLLVHLGWTIPVIFRGLPNVRITSSVVVGRATENVSYRFFDTHARVLIGILDDEVRQGLIPGVARKLIADRLLIDFFPQYIAPGVNLMNNEKPWRLLFSVFWSYQTFWTSLTPLFMRRLAYPLTTPLKHKVKNATIRLLDKLLRVTENARTQRLTDRLGSIGLNSHLPLSATLTNPQRVFIGRRLATANHLTIDVRLGAIPGVEPHVSIGDDVTLGAGVHIACAQEVSIGHSSRLGNRVFISDYATDYSEAARQLPPVQRPLCPYGAVRIGERVLLEDGVCVVGNVTIGDGAVVLAGTLVEYDVAPNTVMGRQPMPVAAMLA